MPGMPCGAWHHQQRDRVLVGGDQAVRGRGPTVPGGCAAVTGERGVNLALRGGVLAGHVADNVIHRCSSASEIVPECQTRPSRAGSDIWKREGVNRCCRCWQVFGLMGIARSLPTSSTTTSQALPPSALRCVVPIDRCGTVPELHRIPSCDDCRGAAEPALLAYTSSASGGQALTHSRARAGACPGARGRAQTLPGTGRSMWKTERGNEREECR